MIERVGIPVTRHLEPDTWHRIDAEGRGPKAGYRAPGTEPGGPGTRHLEPDTRYLILHWVAGTRYRILGENDP